MKRLLYGLVVLSLPWDSLSEARSDFNYWTNCDGGEVRRANLDGSGPTTLAKGLTSAEK
jgi:hypothetical protein